MSSPRDRAGFTLIEVVVALAVAALVLLGARVMLGQLADGAERIAGAAVEADREAGAEALLRRVADRLETSVEEEHRFRGEPHAARFRTWCEVPDGWLEACTASLGIVRVESGNALVLSLSTGEIVPLRRGFDTAHILYLYDAADGGTWIPSWGTAITAPLALWLVVDRDTTIVRIGRRG
jgi:prepilin-type N-terminal cleavage/methylation domain-containing protein